MFGFEWKQGQNHNQENIYDSSILYYLKQLMISELMHYKVFLWITTNHYYYSIVMICLYILWNCTQKTKTLEFDAFFANM